MSNGDIKEIKVVWEGPMNVDAVLDRNGEDDYGLYQIYGWHPAYAKDETPVLLYVGSAIRQTFGRRFRQHRQLWMQHEPERGEKLEARLGRLQDETYEMEPAWDDWQQQVTDAEKLIVWWNTPAYNSKNIAHPPILDTTTPRVRLTNLMECGDILQTCEWPLQDPPKVRGEPD